MIFLTPSHTRGVTSLGIGSVIGGRFRVDQLLGAGGMGFVVAATHLELGHRVAIKLMRDEMLASSAMVERFVREARAVVTLRTEHVCKVLDVARTDAGIPYIVMELLDGVDLARAAAQKPLPLQIAVEYVMQACVALAEAHTAGIIHRDLKPANLFVTRRPDGGPLVKVLDFGIAKAFSDGDASLTRTRVTMGSPGYMSPEQIESARDVDTRTDIWALGVTLYQLLAGRLPFSATNPTEAAIQIAGGPPAPIDLDPGLRAIIFRCLEKSPERRYPDVGALAADLARFGGPAAARIASAVAHNGRPATAARQVVTPPVVTASAPTAASVVAEPPPPRRIAVPVIAGIAALGVAGAIAVVALRGDPPPTHPDAAIASVVAVVAAPAPDAATDAMIEVDAEVDAAEPIDAGTRRKKPPRDQSMAEMMEESNKAMRAGCKTALEPKNAAFVPPVSIAMCWCVVEDAARAQAAFDKLPANMRDSIRMMCAMHKITVH